MLGGAAVFSFPAGARLKVAARIEEVAWSRRWLTR
jgi:hypothetical protein